MKKSFMLMALSTVFAGAVFAQTAAPAAPVSPSAPAAAKALVPAAPAMPAAPVAAKAAAPAAATVNAVCKDGTPFSGDTLKGACRGHGGVDKKAGAAAAAAPAVGKPATKADSAPMAQAPGGGAGKVWANDSTKVYHCANDKFYGKTKHGEYMSEADAKAKGFHGSHGKACTQ
jgi:pyruvate/2-oxoglutarate dehydrogenase complex dihydrolipoamide acyltransferase (E2) component